LEDGLHLGILAKRATIFLLPIALAACAGSDDGRSMSLSADRNDTNPPAPTEYRPQLLAFMKTYLRNPVGVQYAEIAEPMQRSVDGRPGYVICLRFNSREIDGSYRGIRERAGPCDRKHRRNLRRRGLCAVSGIGKDVALKFVERKSSPATSRSLKPARELRSLFSEV
jgi:hypothetical protein